MNTNTEFPKGFLWGAASAACQMEGGIEDRGLTTSDVHAYDPNLDRKGLVENEMTSQQFDELIATATQDLYFPKRFGNDFYNRYMEDINLMKEMGFNSYRFSIAWSRLYPDSSYQEPSQKGLDFYDKVINAIIDAGMEPIITIMHYDIPIWVIKEFGSFAEDTVVDLYMKYATTLLERYGKKVKYWIPFNQINLLQYCGFKSIGVLKDSSDNFEQEQFRAIHNQFKCNALIKKLALDINPEMKIGVMLADCTFIPHTCHPKDVVLAMRRNRMQYFYADVNLRGEYPKSVLKYMHDNNISVNITDEDKKLFKEYKLDYLAFSYYYSRTVDHHKDTMNPADITENPYLTGNDWGWTIDPDGFYNVMCQYHDRYNVPLMVAENGYGYSDVFEDGTVNDDYRIDYLREHIKSMKDAIDDGVEVLAYLPWTSIDLVSSGTAEMSKRYGFVYVDRDDFGKGTNDRFKKKSFYWYQKTITSNGKDLD